MATGLLNSNNLNFTSDGINTNVKITGSLNTVNFQGSSGEYILLTNSYVDTNTWKSVVLVATTANITLSGIQTIDGIAIISGSRILVKNQTSAVNNGIYIGSSTAWSRSTDMYVGLNASAVFVSVSEGTVNANTLWSCTSFPAIVNTNSLTFTQFYTGLTAGGLNTQIQYNNGGLLAGSSNFI
jgi:hypothetical protein